jgi:SOS-response transcriptional repressor LexA
MMGLTPQQRACLDAIEAYNERSGTMPTLEELRVDLGLPGRSAVARLLAQLEDRGAIVRLRHRARAIFVVHQACPHCGADVRTPRSARVR